MKNIYKEFYSFIVDYAGRNIEEDAEYVCVFEYSDNALYNGYYKGCKVHYSRSEEYNKESVFVQDMANKSNFILLEPSSMSMAGDFEKMTNVLVSFFEEGMDAELERIYEKQEEDEYYAEVDRELNEEMLNYTVPNFEEKCFDVYSLRDAYVCEQLLKSAGIDTWRIEKFERVFGVWAVVGGELYICDSITLPEMANLEDITEELYENYLR